MKQFLVPALLLAVLGTVAAVAAGSATLPSEGHGAKAECAAGSHCPSMTGHDVGGMKCLRTSGAAAAAQTETPAAAHSECDMDEECVKRCEDQPEKDCCKKKLECGNCKKDEKPAQKP